MVDTQSNKHENESLLEPDILDVVIVGAGISGINTAYRLQTQLPGIRYTILEARGAIGGTWDFFKYPGLRSDSDLFTFGFAWRPWMDKNPIAVASSILKYLKASAADEGIDDHIQFNTRVQRASWSSKSQTWQLTVISNDCTKQVSTKFLVLSTGYYNYEESLPAVIPGIEAFRGQTIHPQFWPNDLDYADKKVICIGSGATSITLVPALAQKAASVTMLQRSPSYIVSLPNSGSDSWLQKYISGSLAYTLSRLHFMIFPILFYYYCRLFPTASRNMIRQAAAKQLPEGYPVDPNFTPRYSPFDQRVCFAPDGDFYAAIRSGRAKVVTGTVKRVVEDGVILNSGEKIDADIIITATGLKLRWGGKIDFTVDGQAYSVAGKIAWHCAMLQDLPNTFLVMGYTMASWTLGADTIAFLLCRLLKGMRKHKLTSIIPRLPADESVKPQPLMDLTSTYVTAAANDIPRTGDKGPWTRRMNYFTDILQSKYGDVTTGLECYQEDFRVSGVKF